MKNKRNKLGYGILSLALALSLPLNVSATENKVKTEDTQNDPIISEENAPLIEEKDIDTTTQEAQAPAPSRVLAPVSNPTRQAPLDRERNNNYISQKGKENENKEKPFKVNVKNENSPEARLTKETVDEKNHYSLNYGLDIEANGLEKKYTISFFALKDSKIEALNIKNYTVDSILVGSGEKMDKETKQIENDDYKGHIISTKFKDNASIDLEVKFDQEAEAGDYSIYYIVEMDGEKVLGKIDVKLEKNQDSDFAISQDQIVRDYENKDEEKVNPFANLPFAKYLLNDTEENKKLADFVSPKNGADNKVLKITYIDPASDEEKSDLIENIEEYQIPANSLAKLEVVDKEEGKASENPENSESLADKINKNTDLINEKISDDKSADKKEAEEAKEEKASEEKETQEEPETIELEGQTDTDKIISLTQLIDGNTDKIQNKIKDTDKAIEKSSNQENKEEKDAKPNKEEALEQKSSLTEKELEKVTAEVDKLLEDKKKSVLELDQGYDDTEAEIIGLSMLLREQTDKIQALIQQALLNHELDSLEELEKKDPEKAGEEYKRLAKLIQEAKSTTDKANDKLVELDGINLVDNNKDPLIRAKKGEKAVLNLGKLTPITKIEDLTSESPAESERDFSKNLEKKVERAIKKIETVTLTKDDEAKANAEKEEKIDKDTKAEEKKEDDGKSVIEVDKKEKESKDIKEATDKSESESLSLPIFERYLKRIKNQK